MPFPLSGLRMAKSLDNALKIRILLRSVKYCFRPKSKQLYVKDLKAFLTLSVVKNPSFKSASVPAGRKYLLRLPSFQGC